MHFGAVPSDASSLPALRSAYFSDPKEYLVPVRAWASPEFFFLKYGDDAEFAINAEGSQVWVHSSATCPFDTLCAYLVGPVLGFLLRIRGVLCLHASTIEIGGQAFALTGACGAGKSTLAASFAEAGDKVLSDDVTSLLDVGNQFFARPSGLRFKLWPDSLQAIFGGAEEFDRLTADSEKRVVQPNWQDTGVPVRLRTIFFLQERCGGAATAEFGDIDPMSAMVSLASHTYANYLLTPPMRKQEFAAIQRLLGAVSVRSLTPRDDLSALPELREILRTEFEKQLETV